MNKIVQFLNNNKLSILWFINYIFDVWAIIYYNPWNVVTKYPTIVFPTIISIGLISFYSFVLYKLDNNRRVIFEVLLYFFGILLGFCLVVVGIYYLINWFPYVMFIIFMITTITGLLAILYEEFGPKISDKLKQIFDNSTNNLIFLLIFYIPCLFLDLINSIKHQYSITTSTTYLIILVEIIILLVWFFIPFLIREYGKHDAKILLEGPVYLNKETPLGVFQNISRRNKNSHKFPYKYNYALSSWIWINPQSQATNQSYNKPTTLLNYGNVIKIVFNKDKIEILAATSTSKDKANTHDLNNKLIKIYETKNFKYQKWNNFLLNYSGGTLDVFINNKLVASEGNISPIFYLNKVTCGYPDGIHGGIKNIAYYDYKLSRYKIHSIYNLFNL